MTRRAPEYTTEAALCEHFLSELAKADAGWTAYPETRDWDILLVHTDGTQIGIQAKLKLNLQVLEQALEQNAWQSTGPDYRAVLVPFSQIGSAVPAALGITVLTPRAASIAGHWKSAFDWYYCNPEKRHALPGYVPDVAAGVPSPVSLTRWKEAALELAALIEVRGYITRADFRQLAVDHRIWVRQWLEPADIPGTPGAWRWRAGAPAPFQAQHPVVYPQIRDAVAKRLEAAA